MVLQHITATLRLNILDNPMNLHDSLRDLGIGVGGPAGGLLVANIVPDPIMANLSVTLGSLAALTVIIKNVIDIWKNDKK